MVKQEDTVIIICGPTAVGKTALAIQLAQHFKTKIISADSRQCYKELNIGVAKPTTQELNAVQHFFINSHSINDELNAAVFEKYALQKAQEIFTENPIAIMVGGTGLYIKAFCEGMDAIPEVPATLRKKLNDNYKTNGLEWLQNELQTKDPSFWQTAEQQNPQRLLRALEVVEATGQSINSFRKGEKLQRPFNIIKIGLDRPRQELYNRISQRVDNMLHDGLVDEVKSLATFQNLNALKTVGYKEVFNYLDGTCTLQQAVEELKKNTRHYAKRQMTWFKKDEAVKWFEPNTLEEIIQHVK